MPIFAADYWYRPYKFVRISFNNFRFDVNYFLILLVDSLIICNCTKIVKDLTMLKMLSFNSY